MRPFEALDQETLIIVERLEYFLASFASTQGREISSPRVSLLLVTSMLDKITTEGLYAVEVPFRKVALSALFA